jgi:NAD(P) transhydrogenase subunit alpha
MELALAARRVTAISADMIPARRSRRVWTFFLADHGSGLPRRFAAAALPKFFPMLMTAAGTIRPAKVLILGAGVAGLQAIATARRLGAVVEAFDVRRAVKEQVQSLGAKFVEVEGMSDAQTAGGYAKEITEDEKLKQAEAIKRHIARSDVCITTALIPGRRAPILITAEMVHGMRPGSVIVDLAAEQGGNCELCKPGQVIVENGVPIIGTANLQSKVAIDASQMYSRNMEKLLFHLLGGDGVLKIDLGKRSRRGA